MVCKVLFIRINYRSKIIKIYIHHIFFIFTDFSNLALHHPYQFDIEYQCGTCRDARLGKSAISLFGRDEYFPSVTHAHLL